MYFFKNWVLEIMQFIHYGTDTISILSRLVLDSVNRNQITHTNNNILYLYTAEDCF